MAIINEQKIPVYDMDSKESLIARIASVYQTLPKYLVFSGEFPENLRETDLTVEDLLRKIKENAESSTDFRGFLKSISPVPKGLDVRRDIFHVWLAYNKPIAEAVSFTDLMLENFGEDFVDDGYFTSVSDFISFWKKEKDLVKSNLQVNIDIQKRVDEDNKKLYDIFNKIDKGVEYTSFQPEKAWLELKLDLKGVSILEIFNRIVLNTNVPFASVSKYYKILKDFVPSEEWAKNNEEKISIKVQPKVFQDIEEYTNVDIEIEENEVLAKFKLNTEKGYLQQDEFLTRFIGILPGVTYSSVFEKEVLGNFEFPAKNINTYVLSDLVMNDKIFSSLINIDEGSKATKKKGEGGQPWLYIHFNHPSTGHITAGISQKSTETGTPYIRVRAKGRDKNSVEAFQELFSKLLIIYEERYEDIVSFYKKYLRDFGKVEKVEKVEKKKKVPTTEVFVKNYSRNCKEDRIPIVYDKKKKGALAFPREYPGKGPRYPSDGKEQKYYTCENPEYPYPGLQTNKLPANAEEYPYVPCCFKNDPSEKEGGVYRHYFYGEELEMKEKKQQDLIVTDKFLSANKYGIIPTDLEKLFSNMDSEPGYKYVRVGVARGYSSFLNCVMLALYEQTGILDVDQENMEDFLEKTRLKLTEKDILPMALQSNYDSSIETLKSVIKDNSAYFNPKLFSQLLEGYFDCNIFLFDKEGIVSPRYTQGYYRIKRDAPCIFIFEHMGSESDHAKYPQCELIVRWNEKSAEDTQYAFNYNQKISKSVEMLYSILLESYILNKKLKPVVFPMDSLKIVSQAVDSYGKCRRIDIVHKRNKVSIFTTPIPPIGVPLAGDDFYAVSGAVALDVFTMIKAEGISQSVQFDIAKELSGTVGNIDISIHLKDEAPLENIPINNNIGTHYPEKKTSSLQKYNRNKKFARYITEYLFWIFSNYVKNKKEITDEILLNFAKEKIILKEDYEYEGEVSKTFSDRNIFMERGKLIASSEDMQKRLMYVLKLYSIRNLKNLLSYKDRKTIVNYYVDISDFDQIPGQVILQGDYALEKWIQESALSFTVNEEVRMGTQLPYFFKNPNIQKGKIFLAQNTSDLKSAMEVCINWDRRGYNPGYFGTEDLKKNYKFNLYSYKSPDDIERYDIEGNDSKHRLNILGYKISGKPYYVSLLSL